MKTEAAELAVAGAATKTTYITGAASAVLGFLGSNAFAVIFGALIALATFLVNWYYKRKDHERKKRAEQRAIELDAARLEAIRRRGRSDSDLAPLGEDD